MRTVFSLATAVALGNATPSPAAAQETASAPKARACTFQSLSPEEKSRYQSRYRRRVRVDGQAYADRWLREEVCITAEARRALRPSAKGKNCRAVSRPVTSMDGSMTVGIGRKCD